jgi:hypothetical protein
VPLQPLDNLVRIGQLKVEPPVKAEINSLINYGQARLADAAIVTLTLGSRFDLAYNAAYALSLAALRWHGYRSENHFQVFQCLIYTLGLENAQWRVLDQAYRTHNLLEYKGCFDVNKTLVDSLIRITEVVARGVTALGPVRLAQ